MTAKTSTNPPAPIVLHPLVLPGAALARIAFAAGVLTASAAGSGCQPSLPTGLSGRADPADPPREPEVLLEPDSPLDAAPPVLRAHIVPAEGAETDASHVLLVRGHVGDGHVRQVEHGDLSQALQDRILPSINWPLDDGTVVLAPTLALEPGITVGILSGDPPLGVDVRVEAGDPVPLLRRVWPPLDVPGGPFAILCGDRDIAPPPAQITLDPGALAAAATIGVFQSIGARCLRIDVPAGALAPCDSADPPPAADPAPCDSADPPPAADPATGDPADPPPAAAVPPPLLELTDGSLVRLDPAPFSLGPAPETPPPAPLECAAPDIPFGPGCVRVADDRLFVTSPDTALLWAVRAGEGEAVRVTRPGEPWVLHGLHPGAQTMIQGAVLDAAGRAAPFALSVFTLPPMPHVVISEVLANPLGPEPDQEWIEITNDGLAAADLTGYVLADIGGETPLPPAVLEPGEHALIVNEAFVEDGEFDPAPAPGTALLRVPKLGKDGLKNDGEPLKLLDAGGEVVSRFPLAPKPKAGQSLARVSPSAPDGVAASFFVASPTPGAPNTPP